jgi:hypothetical protein
MDAGFLFYGVIHVWSFRKVIYCILYFSEKILSSSSLPVDHLNAFKKLLLKRVEISFTFSINANYFVSILGYILQLFA